MHAPSLSALVGRDRELSILRERLATALTGHGGLVLIGGEAGVGKTALAESLCREAAEQGALVLVGRCYDLTETPPYGPWVELFGQYQPDHDGPQLPDAFAARGAIGDVTSQAALFQQVRDFLGAMARARPAVLLLDDLHWADPASLDLLRVVARDVAASALLILVTYRSDELTRRHPLYQLLPVLDREARATRLDLRSLPADAVRSLVARYRLPDGDRERLVDHLQVRAQGNALFVTQLLRALEETSTLHTEGNRWALGDLARVQVPMPLKQVIDGRLMRLGEEAQRLLTMAAVIGQEVPLLIWATVAGMDDDTLSGVMEQAAGAHLVEETADGAAIRFIHALIRETLYESVAPSQRRRLHRQAGEALAARPDANPDTVAYHFQRADDMRAAEWLIKAGERAQRAYAWLTAASRFEAALALLERDGSDDNMRGWLHYHLAILRRYADPRRGVIELEEAVRLATASNDPSLAASALFYQGLLRCFGDDIELGLEQMKAGAAALHRFPGSERMNTAGHAAPDGTFAVWLAVAGRFTEAIAAAERFLADPLRDASHGTAADAHWGLAVAHAYRGNTDEAVRAFTQAKEGYRALGHFYQVGYVTMYQIQAVALPLQADHIADRRRLTEEAEEAWKNAGDVWANLPAHFARFPLMYLEGDWEGVHHILLHIQTPSTLFAGDKKITEAIVGCLAHQQGDIDGAWSAVRDRLPEGPQTRPGTTDYSTAIILQCLAGILAIDARDLIRAREWLEAHDRWLAWSGAVLGQSEGHALWAQFHRAAGDHGTAYASASRALDHAINPRQPLALLAAHRLLGELHADAHRFADAQTHLDTGLVLADACAASYERALTLLALAELSGGKGDTDTASVLLDEVRAICTPLGAKPVLARADALSTRLAATRTTAPAYPAGLSAREVEVLRLVAEGQTNRAIADTLFLSEHTVRVHVRTILTKTATDNRTAAAAFARLHGLA